MDRKRNATNESHRLQARSRNVCRIGTSGIVTSNPSSEAKNDQSPLTPSPKSQIQRPRRPQPSHQLHLRESIAPRQHELPVIPSLPAESRRSRGTYFSL